MTLDAFTAIDWPEGFLGELARGVVTEIAMPGINHCFIVGRIADMFIFHEHDHQGVIRYGSGGANCRIWLPGIHSCRRPDQAIYLLPEQIGRRIWQRWIPQIVVEVVNRQSEHRDYVEKREEYHLFGVLEYWIFDPKCRKLLVLKRWGDLWHEKVFDDSGLYRTELLPNLEVSVGRILGPVPEEDDDEFDDVEI